MAAPNPLGFARVGTGGATLVPPPPQQEQGLPPGRPPPPVEDAHVMPASITLAFDVGPIDKGTRSFRCKFCPFTFTASGVVKGRNHLIGKKGIDALFLARPAYFSVHGQDGSI